MPRASRLLRCCCGKPVVPKCGCTQGSIPDTLNVELGAIIQVNCTLCVTRYNGTFQVQRTTSGETECIWVYSFGDNSCDYSFGSVPNPTYFYPWDTIEVKFTQENVNDISVRVQLIIMNRIFSDPTDPLSWNYTIFTWTKTISTNCDLFTSSITMDWDNLFVTDPTRQTCTGSAPNATAILHKV